MIKFRITLIKILFNPKFIIVIKDGRVTNEYGNVKQIFINDCQDIVNANEILNGLIYFGKYSNRITISKNIPQSSRQKLRNAWSFSN